MSREVAVGAVKIGGGSPLALIAGPCVLESEKLCLETAGFLKKLTEGMKLPFIFKSSYDKANRTSVKGFRGPGLSKGLKLLEKAKKEFGMPVLTDVHTEAEAREAAGAVDCLQIPAFLCRQTDLLAAAARTGKPVNVKKGQFLAPWDMKNAVEKIESAGSRKVLLTERGVSFGYNNLAVDFRSLVILAGTGYPVVFDATHSVQLPGGAGHESSGQREFVAPLARAAAAVGMDALFMEVHPDPDRALSDGPNMVGLADLKELLEGVLAVDAARRGRRDAPARGNGLGRLKVFIDGGSRGNPGESALGVVLLKEDGELVEEIGRRIGVTTNNVAEYQALIAALKRAAEMGAEHLEIVTDSELLARQMNGQYKIKDDKMKKLAAEAQKLSAAFKGVKIRNVPREQNREADRLVNEALDKK